MEITRRPKLSEEKGAALTEFSIVFPWLFIIILGFVDLCGYLQSYRAVSGLASQGAIRAARLENLVDQDPRVKAWLNTLVDEINTPKVQIKNPGFSVKRDNDIITVEVSATHDFLFDPINIANASWSPISGAIKAKASTSYRTSVTS